MTETWLLCIIPISLYLLGMMHSPGIEGNVNFNFQNLMNADSLYAVSHYILLLNLKLSNTEYYRKKPAQSPVLLVRSKPALTPTVMNMLHLATSRSINFQFSDQI